MMAWGIAFRPNNLRRCIAQTGFLDFPQKYPAGSRFARQFFFMSGSPRPSSACGASASGGIGHAVRYIQPGNPQQNVYIERFNRTVRYDWLGHYLFESLNELQEFATNWLWAATRRNSVWHRPHDLYF